MYHCDEVRVFEEAWKALLSNFNIADNPWLMSIYELKEKWAACYMKDSKTLGIRSTQLNESINSFIKNCTNPKWDINQFLEAFEQAVVDKRYNELKSDFNSRQKLPRLILKSSTMLQQLSQVHTPPLFDLFQQEYDLRDATCIKERQERKIKEDDDATIVFDYVITRIDKKGEWTLTFEPPREEKEATITCSCKKFEQWGILCCHALRILYDHDIKLLPHTYISKRWTREARCGVVYDNKGKEIEVDPKLECSNPYKQLCPMLIKLASDASECPETFFMVHQAVLELSNKVSALLIKHSSNGVTNEGDIDNDDGKNDGQRIGFKKRECKKIDKSWETQNTLEIASSSTLVQHDKPTSLSVQHGLVMSCTAVPVQYNPPISNIPVQMQHGSGTSCALLPMQYGPPVSNTPIPVQYGISVSNSLPPMQYGPSMSNTPMPMQHGPLISNTHELGQMPLTTLMMSPVDYNVKSLEALEFSQAFNKGSQMNLNPPR
ncbi:protein FAR1-RELATED SEQUENCE 1-like [Neltuma alba]|uniref:protein FAR1-RELATED SEQUENCE 1-like n=1 Tax=Neltuma alba TaxID=207710 RepID=UPI0010A54F11|nr:protein FAR1-RELATED SEQUENCE 1-like [Prosopis alba]